MSTSMVCFAQTITGNQVMGTLLPQIGALAVFAVVGVPVSLIGFSFGVRWAKVRGTLGRS